MDVANDSCHKSFNDESWLKQIYDEKVMNTNAKYVFVYANIKRFQYMNDKYGRKIADEVVEVVYDVLKKHLRKDEYVARIYGDHFNLMVEYHNMEDVYKGFLSPFVDDIFEQEHPLIYHNIYMSFGFYFIEDQVDFYTAQNRANIARTQCPQKKNRTFSYEEFTAELYERYRKENEMADSVTKARFNQEFVPYVQPKVDVKTKKIVGGEVLLRWFDEDGKEIALSEFLPVLNKFADIYLVDFNIFEQVCKFMHHCNKEGKKMVPLSFNITNTSFFDNDFINDYTTMLEKYKLSESMIEFEFMENIQFGNYEKVKQIISTFRKAGFLCALDDFGSGYSSFNILLNSQIDILKLDRVFFNKELNEENRTAIQSIINICKKLHVKVIAEGIEDQKYVDYLEQAGCDIIQGFYFYKPMSLDAFQQLIQQES